MLSNAKGKLILQYKRLDANTKLVLSQLQSCSFLSPFFAYGCDHNIRYIKATVILLAWFVFLITKD
jgi:hypothetical protein